MTEALLTAARVIAGDGESFPQRVDESARVRDAVVHLTRLVQRAAIYPAGHPTVRLALAPFLDAVRPYGEGAGHLLLVVLRDRLTASTSETAPQEFPSPWLASRLHARGISSLTIGGALDADDLLTFARWLAGPAQAPAPTGVAGLTVTRVDYKDATYETTPNGEAAETPAALAAWQRVAASLTAAAGTAAATPDGGFALLHDPAHIAASIGARVADSEGTGVSEVSERILVASTRLQALSADARGLVKQRLAAVVATLPDEVRTQLLSAVPNDDPRKFELLTTILEDLPAQRLLELVPRVDMRRGTHISPFLTFLSRLCAVAARDAVVSEAMETQLGRHGLPGDLVHGDPENVRKILDHAFDLTAEQYASVGDFYQARIHELAPEPRPIGEEEIEAALAEAADPHLVTEHAAQIALTLVRAEPADASTPICLAYAKEAAQRTASDGRLGLLAELASVAARVAETSPDGPTRALVQECLALTRQPMTIDQIIDAVGRHVGSASETLTALFLASGLSGTTAALARMSALPDGSFRDRLGELVARQDIEIVRSALTRLNAAGTPVMTILRVLRAIDPLRTPDLVRLFIRDPDPAVRRDALELLADAPLAPVKRERVMIQALQDRDGQVASAAVRQLCANLTSGSLAALTAFLSKVEDRTLEPLQLEAVRQLGGPAPAPAAVPLLAAAVRARRHIFDGGPRRVSRAMVAVLEGQADEEGRAAARAWRRSAAGLWSACVGSRGQA